MGNARLKIAAFKKLGAVPANGKPGFMCDYMLQLTMEGGNSPVLANFMNRFGGSIITARFVKTDGKWIWIPPDSEGGG